MNDAGFCHECWNKLPFIKEPYCSLCSYQLKDIGLIDGGICGMCIKRSPKFDKIFSLLHFNKDSKYLIHDFKYNDNVIYGSVFANLMINRYQDEIRNIDLILPVPMHKYKRLWRLYNHSQILAHDIAKQLQKKANSNILLKVKNTISQSGLRRRIRVKNLLGSFKISNSQKIQGKSILLVDDVVTTSSTVNICASELKKAGAKEVKVLCIARRMLDNT